MAGTDERVDELVRSLDDLVGVPLRPWQQQVARRLLEAEVAVRDQSQRQTGRTTRMLIAAHDAKVLGERVLIIAPNSDIMRHLMGMARALGIMDGGVQPKPLIRFDFTSTHHVMHNGKLRGFRGQIFEDHTVAEFSPPVAYTRELDMWYAVSAPKPVLEPEPVGPRWKFVPF